MRVIGLQQGNLSTKQSRITAGRAMAKKAMSDASMVGTLEDDIDANLEEFPVLGSDIISSVPLGTSEEDAARMEFGPVNLQFNKLLKTQIVD